MTLKRAFIIFLMLALPAGCATQPQTAENSPERAVETTFLSYQKALLDRDGAAAAALVTEDSWAYYRNMADEALTADRQRLQDMDFVDRLTALTFRHALTPADLRRMNGMDLVAVSVDKGWISREKTAKLRLTNYRITGNTATAAVLSPNGKPSSVSMGFRSERGAWRLDLLDNINTARSAMPLAIALSGMSEEELLFASLERATGSEAGPEIWTPPS